MNKEQEYRTYEFEYLSEVKLSNRRASCFMSAIDLKVGDCVIIEKENKGRASMLRKQPCVFLGRIIGVYDCEGWHAAQAAMQCNTDYILVGKSGEVVSAYIDAVDKEKRKEELIAEMEAKFKKIDKERKFEYYATLEG